MGEVKGRARAVVFPARVLRAKYKHALAFGLTRPYSRTGASDFEAVLRRHIDAPTTRVVTGTFRGRQEVTLYVDPSTGLMVMTTRGGRFKSGWRLSEEQLHLVMERGTL